MSPLPQVGETLGHYRLDGSIAAGPTGLVHAATDQRLGRQVAVKVVLGNQTSSAAYVEQFQRDAAMLARLDSPHVISVYDHGVERGWPWLAMRYAAGGDLGRMLRTRGPFPPGLAAVLAAQVADALVDAHRVGVVHRDVKPANVLLRDERPDRLHAYLADFGAARPEAPGGAAQPGSQAYLAPERIEGARGEEASDVYAVGCLLHETLTGRPPFTGTDAEVAQAHRSAPVPQLPGGDPLTHDLNRVLARTLAKRPDDRYRSATELRDDLRAIAGRQQTPSTPPPPPSFGSAPSAPAPSGRRGKGLLIGGLAAAVVLLLVLAGTLFAVLRGGDDDTDGGTTTTPDQVVQGDLDDDGFGDFVGGAQSYTPAYVSYSDGESLSAPEELPRVAFPGVVGDADADGLADVISITGPPPDLAVEVSSQDGSRVASTIDVPRSQFNNYLAAAIDVDGDGDDDLAVLTVGQGGRQLVVTGALNDGDGQFSGPRTWAAFDSQADYSSPAMAAGDFDGDGLDDLAVLNRDDDYEQRLWVLPGGDGQVAAPEPPQLVDFPQSDYVAGTLSGADVDGDDTDEILLDNADRVLYVLRLEDGTVTSPEAWTTASGSSELFYGGPSDVDGDGLSDWLRVEPAGPGGNSSSRVVALRSTGESFERIPSFDLVLPEAGVKPFARASIPST